MQQQDQQISMFQANTIPVLWNVAVISEQGHGVVKWRYKVTMFYSLLYFFNDHYLDKMK